MDEKLAILATRENSIRDDREDVPADEVLLSHAGATGSVMLDAGSLFVLTR